MEAQEIISAVEGILFASGDPMSAERIALVLGVETGAVLEAARSLADSYSFERRGLRIVRLDDKLQMCSAPELAPYITRAMERRRPPRLSQPALEALAVVAYFQPVTRAYIDQVRGVDSSYTVSLLLERGLIEPAGRLDAPGRPTLFRTSDAFLRTMGVSSLEELPALPDMESDEGMKKLQSAIEAIRSENEQLTIQEPGEADGG